MTCAYFNGIGAKRPKRSPPSASSVVSGPRKLFISYAHGEPDQTLAGVLRDSLRQAGHEVFIDTEILLGSSWDAMIAEKVAESDYFVLLLSARSVHSEMVREEARLAHERRKAEGAPRLLPVRVAYDGLLGYALGAWVNPYQWATWETPDDDERVLRQILDVVTGRAEAPAPGAAAPAGPAPSDNFHRPEPAADLSDLTAPGGTLPPDDPFYIERTTDRAIHAAAHRRKETVVIKASRQMGKSSLLGRYLAECRRAGKRTNLIDLSLFAIPDLADYPTFLSALAKMLFRRLRLVGQSPAITSQSDMSNFVQDRVLGDVPDNLVLAFDEADRILGQPYQSDFFTMLRYWCNQRADTQDPEWARLELALVISTEPYLLIRDADRSPFNVSVPFVLDPFNADECRELNRRYDHVLDDDQAERLRRELLNGHPFLTRLAYYHLTRPDAPDFATLMENAGRPDGPFGDHLRALLTKLRRYSQQDLLTTLRQVIRHKTIPNDDAFARLHGAGLVRQEGNRVVPANNLYARFFGELP